MKNYLFFIVGLFSLVLSAQPKGWKVKENSHTIVYTPKNGSFFFFIVYKPKMIKPELRKDWLIKVVNGFEKAYDTSPDWEIEQKDANEWSVTSNVIYKGRKTIVTYATKNLSDIDAYIINASGSPKLFDKYMKLYFKSIVKNANKKFHKTPIVKEIDTSNQIVKKVIKENGKASIKQKNKTKEKEQIEIASKNPSRINSRIVKRPKYKPQRMPNNVANYIYYLYYDKVNSSPIFESILIFSNGNCTRDIETVLNEGVAISKKKHLNEWGKYKINDFNKLEIKWYDEHKYYKKSVYRTLKTLPNKLENCWTNYSSSKMIVYRNKKKAFINNNKWCFHKNGRFENTGASSISKHGTDKKGKIEYLISGTSPEDRSGWYFINGNILQLFFDNGNTLVTTIGYGHQSDENEKADLYVGSKRFSDL